MQLSWRFQPIELRGASGASGLDAARLVGPFPRGQLQGWGVDLIRSDPQFSNPFSPTQQVYGARATIMRYPMLPLHLYLQPQSSGTGQQGRRAPVYQRTFVGDGSISSRAAIRRQRGSGTEEAWVRMGTAVLAWREPRARPWHNSPSGIHSYFNTYSVCIWLYQTK